MSHERHFGAGELVDACIYAETVAGAGDEYYVVRECDSRPGYDVMRADYPRNDVREMYVCRAHTKRDAAKRAHDPQLIDDIVMQLNLRGNARRGMVRR